MFLQLDNYTERRGLSVVIVVVISAQLMGDTFSHASPVSADEASRAAGTGICRIILVFPRAMAMIISVRKLSPGTTLPLLPASIASARVSSPPVLS